VSCCAVSLLLVSNYYPCLLCSLCVLAQAAADSAALQPPAGDSGSPSSSSSGPPSTRDAVYLKTPLAGGVQEFLGRSVVVLGDVPSGAVLRAGGDIIVLGR
jgi:septum formation inhibitor MinC